MSKKRKRAKIWQREGKTNRHHILNKCRGGTWALENIITWDIGVHNAWHFLFQNMTIREVADWLIFVDEQKKLGIDTDVQK